VIVPAIFLSIVVVQANTTAPQLTMVSGRITDTEGAPIEFGLVLLRPASSDEPLPPIKVVQTDIAGYYVIDLVPPGGYIVEAVGPARPPSAFGVEEYRRTYYPGVQTLADAKVIDVSAGARVSGVNIALPQVDGPLIEGRVVGGVLGEQPVIGLLSSPAGIVRRGRINEDGAFRFIGLREGRYVVWASVSDAQGLLVASQTINLEQKPQSVSLRLQRAGKIRGRIVVSGRFTALDGVRVGAALTDRDSDIDPLLTQQTTVAPDGTFAIDGLFGTRTIRVLGLPAECQVENLAAVTFKPAETIDIRVAVSCQ
jgi:hypothetical protein